jgi:hypothetical protein
MTAFRSYARVASSYPVIDPYRTGQLARDYTVGIHDDYHEAYASVSKPPPARDCHRSSTINRSYLVPSNFKQVVNSKECKPVRRHRRALARNVHLMVCSPLFSLLNLRRNDQPASECETHLTPLSFVCQNILAKSCILPWNVRTTRKCKKGRFTSELTT